MKREVWTVLIILISLISVIHVFAQEEARPPVEYYYEYRADPSSVIQVAPPESETGQRGFIGNAYSQLRQGQTIYLTPTQHDLMQQYFTQRGVDYDDYTSLRIDPTTNTVQEYTPRGFIPNLVFTITDILTFGIVTPPPETEWSNTNINVDNVRGNRIISSIPPDADPGSALAFDQTGGLCPLRT